MNLIQQTENPAYKLMLKDGTMFDVTEDLITLYEQAYPQIDVHEQLRKMVVWCVSNESKRKTRRGIKRCINGWLNREASKVICARANTTQRDYTASTTIQQRVTDLSWADGL